MVKAEFSFFQMQVEGDDGYSVELLQPAFGITPERLNAVDMVLTLGKLIGAVVNSEMLIKTDIYQAIITAPAVRVNHRIGCDVSPDHPLQRGFGAIRHNLGIDSPVAFQQTKHNRLAISACGDCIAKQSWQYYVVRRLNGLLVNG